MRTCSIRTPIVTGLLTFVLLLNVAMPATGTQTGKDLFYLSVKLNDIFNPDLQIRVPVTANKPFQVTVENGDVKTTISGVVHDLNEGKYPVTLKVAEWSSEKNNITDGAELHLELDQPSGYGPVASFVYVRIVTLSRRKPL